MCEYKQNKIYICRGFLVVSYSLFVLEVQKLNVVFKSKDRKLVSSCAYTFCVVLHIKLVLLIHIKKTCIIAIYFFTVSCFRSPYM